MLYRTLEGLPSTLFGDAPLRGRMDAARTAMGTALRTVITRRGLVELDERALADIGLTREEALAEARRSAWDVQPPRRPRRPNPAPARTATLWARLREAWLRRRSRHAITSLDARMLKDIGVSYSEAEHEANKLFWHL